jgi:ankyrin repeat protein
MFHSIVRELIKNDGTIINDEDADSNTALHLSSTNGHWRVIEALLEKGAVIDARLVTCDQVAQWLLYLNIISVHLCVRRLLSACLYQAPRVLCCLPPDVSYWTSRENSSELIELFSINRVSSGFLL